MEHKDHVAPLVGFTVGIIAGGILGILFAPKSGKETREQLVEMGENTRDKIKDFIKKGEKLLNE